MPGAPSSVLQPLVAMPGTPSMHAKIPNKFGPSCTMFLQVTHHSIVRDVVLFAKALHPNPFPAISKSISIEFLCMCWGYCARRNPIKKGIMISSAIFKRAFSTSTTASRGRESGMAAIQRTTASRRKLPLWDMVLHRTFG